MSYLPSESLLDISQTNSAQGFACRGPANARDAPREIRAYMKRMADLFADTAPDAAVPAEAAPLADRPRPHTLGEVVGQEHLTGPTGAIGRMVAAGRLSSMILWGPPGTGKTT